MSPCSGCHAGCCRSFAIPVTGADILRIARSESLSFWDFIVRWEDSSGSIAGNYVPHFYFADEPRTPFAICLKQVESQQFPGTRRCRFLDESAPEPGKPFGTARCGIYGSRPSACRVFPTRFESNSPLVVLNQVPERALPESAGAIYQLCPREWTPQDVDVIDGPQDLAVARYEADFFQQVAAVWNRQILDWKLFPDFLEAVYSDRVREAQPAQAREEVRETLPFAAPAAKPRRRAA